MRSSWHCAAVDGAPALGLHQPNATKWIVSLGVTLKHTSNTCPWGPIQWFSEGPEGSHVSQSCSFLRSPGACSWSLMPASKTIEWTAFLFVRMVFAPLMQNRGTVFTSILFDNPCPPLGPLDGIPHLPVVPCRKPAHLLTAAHTG